MSVKEKDAASLMEGDELAVDIKDVNGQLLLPAGQLLNNRSIELLRRRDIQTVTVKLDQTLDKDQYKKLKEEVIERIDHKFRKVGANPVMQELHKLVIEYRLQGL